MNNMPRMDVIFQLDGKNPDLSMQELRSLLYIGGAISDPFIKKGYAFERGLVRMKMAPTHIPVVADLLRRRSALVRGMGVAIGRYDSGTGRVMGVEGMDDLWEYLPPQPYRIDVVNWTFGLKGEEVSRVSKSEYLKIVGAIKGMRGLRFSVRGAKARVICYLNVWEQPVVVETFSIPPRTYSERVATRRPFFRPMSLHPKLARAMVNISLIKPGEILLDPFCGTGGVLIEAALVGAIVYGIDVDETVCAGCRRNLDTLCREWRGEIIHGNFISALEMSKKGFKAVVSDLPYGRSTPLKGHSIQDLYREFLSRLPDILAKDDLAVLMFPMDVTHIAEDVARVLFHTHIRVHRSLTRHMYVFASA